MYNVTIDEPVTNTYGVLYFTKNKIESSFNNIILCADIFPLCYTGRSLFMETDNRLIRKFNEAIWLDNGILYYNLYIMRNMKIR